MKKLLSGVALSVFFMAGPALADNAMLLTDTQMDVVTGAGGLPACCTTTRTSLRNIQVNVQDDFGQSIQNLRSDLSTQVAGGAANSR